MDKDRKNDISYMAAENNLKEQTTEYKRQCWRHKILVKFGKIYRLNAGKPDP